MSRLSASATTDAVLAELGRRLRRVRLDQNRTVEEVAEEAGVGARTLSRLEGGEGATLANVVRVLRALGRLEALEDFLPEPTVSPLELVEREGRRRQRASGAQDGEDVAAPRED